MHATRLMALAAVVALALPGAPAGAAPLAFPGAVGAAAWAVGGRGGVVIQVTNLNNSGIGSLRACVEATGPRTCVFRVGGTINLISQIRARGTNDFLTIAGQTAPGGGILLRATSAQTSGNLLAFFGSESNFVSDVIVRNIRVRRGGVSPQLDAVEVKYGDNVILDHVSASWGSDETLSIARSRRVTVQHSIIAEGLGSHGFGSLLIWATGRIRSIAASMPAIASAARG